MLDLPHPLLCHDINFSRTLGRRSLLEVNQCSPGKNHHENAEGYNRPGNFEGCRAFDLFGAAILLTAVADRKDRDHDEDREAHDGREQHQKYVERVYVADPGGGACWPKWEIIEHTLLSSPCPVLCRRSELEHHNQKSPKQKYRCPCRKFQDAADHCTVLPGIGIVVIAVQQDF